MIESDRLFGIPFFTTHIDPTLYDKDQLVKDIKSNYLKNPTRNEWDNLSYLHHSYNDWDNPDYINVNFSRVQAVYNKIIPQCLQKFKLKSGAKGKFRIVNYNCMSENGYMAPHKHLNFDFVGIHYLQFDPKVHVPTEFINDFAQKSNVFVDDVYTSCYKSTWRMPVKEDMLCITPGFLSHQVPKQPKTNKLRMSIITNIQLELVM